jgi:hypothetical protein
MQKRTQIGLKLDPDQVGRIDAYRATLEWPVARTAVIEKAIDEFLDRHEQAAAKPASGAGRGRKGRAER